MVKFAGKAMTGEDVARTMVAVLQVVATVARYNPVAGAAVSLGVAAIAASLGVYSLLGNEKLEKENSTMREIEARLKCQEEECKRIVAEADQRTEVAERGIDREALAKLDVEKSLAQAEEAMEALLIGIRPVVWPTEEQFSVAKKRLEYDPEKFHFAVCGTARSGKSSLINAFRGLKSSDEGGAKVGVTECTSEVTRYPDPSNELPGSRFVWYDIPGAWTPKVPGWQYFNDQGLFAFDLIIMVYDVRFTTFDEDIIKNCLRFNIPLLIVRSKSDQHIGNMILAEFNCVRGDPDYEEHYQKVAEKYVEETRSNFNDNMTSMAESPDIGSRYRQLLYEKRVYIVAQSSLRELLQKKTIERKRRTSEGQPIDEYLLIEDLLKQAARRRYRHPDKHSLQL